MLKTKLVLTGGPCAGKTDILTMISDFKINDSEIIVVSESARFLHEAGLKIGTNISLEGFQDLLLKIQFAKELNAEIIAMKSSSPTIVVCDRGIIDNKVYSGEELFQTMMKLNGFSEKEIVDTYDKIIFLQSIASILPDVFLKLRPHITDIKKALELDERTYTTWREISDNVEYVSNGDYAEKKKKVMQTLCDEALKNTKKTAYLQSFNITTNAILDQIIRIVTRLNIPETTKLNIIENALN